MDGGGSDLEESVSAAGLVLITDKMITSDDKNCASQLEKRRTKRAVQLEERATDKVAQLCCQLGHSKYLSEWYEKICFKTITQRPLNSLFSANAILTIILFV